MNEKRFSYFTDPQERKAESLPAFGTLPFARYISQRFAKAREPKHHPCNFLIKHYNMEKEVLTEMFDQGKLTVKFVIDNIRYYDKTQILIEKEDEFICFFNFKEPSILLLEEIVKTPSGEIAVYKNANNALNAALNYVKTKFNLQD